MSDLQRAADICDELSAKLAEAGNSGKAHERIDEMIAACEWAQQQVAEIMGSFSRCRRDGQN